MHSFLDAYLDPDFKEFFFILCFNQLQYIRFLMSSDHVLDVI